MNENGAMSRDYDPDARAQIEALLSEWLEDEWLAAETGLDFAPPLPVTDVPSGLSLSDWLRRSEEVHRFLRHRTASV